MSETTSIPAETSGAQSSTGAASPFTGEMDQLKSDIARLKDDFRKILDDSLSVARAGTGSAKNTLNNKFSDVQERGQEAVKSLEEMIEERPLTSLAIAAGVGFLLGKLLD